MPVPTPVVTPAAATRRTTIGALLLGLGAVAGCDLDPSTGNADGSQRAVGEPMAALGRLHDAQAAALDAAPSTASATSPGPTFADPAAALRAVQRREQRLEKRLVDWSVAARSGALARLLAAMSAGVAQHLAVLPGTVGT